MFCFSAKNILNIGILVSSSFHQLEPMFWFSVSVFDKSRWQKLGSDGEKSTKRWGIFFFNVFELSQRTAAKNVPKALKRLAIRVTPRTQSDLNILSFKCKLIKIFNLKKQE